MLKQIVHSSRVLVTFILLPHVAEIRRALGQEGAKPIIWVNQTTRPLGRTERPAHQL